MVEQQGDEAPGGGARPRARGHSAAERLLRTSLKLRHLRLIVALDDQRKLNRAAADLGLSQPAASKMLGEIEKIVGVPLFERLPRGVEPTWYGEALIRRTRTVLSELGRAGEEIAALKGGGGGTVAIGTVMAPAVETVLQAIQSVRRRRLRLQISVDVETSDILVERLLASRLDFVIARLPRGLASGALDYREAGPEEGCLIVRAEHPLAGLDVVRPADLSDREWVLQPHGSLLRHSIEAMLRRNGVAPPDQVLNTGSLLMTMVMVAKTDTIAAFSSAVAELFVTAGHFKILPLAEAITIEPFGLIRMKGVPLSPAAEILYRAVEQHLFARADGAA